MAVDQQQEPQQGQIHGSEPPPPVASTSMKMMNANSKRQRRPSVRLGEIGEQPASSLTKHTKNLMYKSSKTRPLSNLGELQQQQQEKGNLESFGIGSWKMKGCSTSSKRVRTNWASKFDDGEDGFSRDFEMEDDSPFDSMENERDLNVGVNQDSRVGIGDDDVVDLDRPSDNGCRNSREFGRRSDGVRVWLNGLGLGRYWPVFRIHEVDEEVLPLLTLEDLKDMGITAVGSRRKMFCAIQKFSKGFA